MPTRDELYDLVRTLPEESLGRAAAALRHLRDGPPMPRPMEHDPVFDHIKRRRRERLHATIERLRSDRRQSLFAGGGVGGGSIGPDGKRNGRFGFDYVDEDLTQAYEHIVIRDNRELRITERVRVDEARRTMTVRLDLVGPDGTAARFEHMFALPDTTRH